MRMERNGRREALRNLSFHFIWERWCLFNISPQNRREGTLHIHRSCTHIYLIYVYMCMCVCIYSYIYTHTHPAVLFWKRKDNSAKHVLVVAWLQLLFSFLCPLWCLPNTVDLNEEKSLKTPPPSFKSNQVNDDVCFYRNDWINEGLVFVCFSGLNYFESLTAILFVSLFLSFRVQKGPFKHLEQ